MFITPPLKWPISPAWAVNAAKNATGTTKAVLIRRPIRCVLLVDPRERFLFRTRPGTRRRRTGELNTVPCPRVRGSRGFDRLYNPGLRIIQVNKSRTKRVARRRPRRGTAGKVATSSTREHILAAALEVFAERGFDGAR